MKGQIHTVNGMVRKSMGKRCKCLSTLSKAVKSQCFFCAVSENFPAYFAVRKGSS